MDHPRLTSPPATRVHDNNPPCSPHRPTSRTSPRSSSSASISFSRPSAGRPIPNVRQDFIPPALPPPANIVDLAMGRDPGWQFGNMGNRKGGSGLGTYAAGSDARLPGSWDLHKEVEMDIDRLREERCESSTPTVPSPHNIPGMHGFNHQDEGYYSLSGTSISQLHGERPLERQNRKNSSHAYDKHLLNRIGRPNTPPRLFTPESMDVSPVAQGPYFQKTKHPQPLKSTSFSDRSLSTSSESPFKVGSPFGSKWSSPKSIVVSPPSLISTAASAKSFADYRSPTFDSASTPISATDSERFARIRQPSRRSNSNGSILAGALGDGGSSAGRTKRGASYDQGIFTTESDLDSDFPSEETGGMRQLHLDDPSTPSIDVQSPNSRLGMKRRASSPPPELTHDSKSPLQTVGGTSSDLYQRRTSGHLSANRASPVHPHSATHGSVSPASSGGPPNGSYASSAGLSVGGNSGSITSISSHERSPGGISPLSEQHESRDSQYVNTAPFDPTFQNSTPLPLQHLNSDIIAARKMSSDNANHSKHSNAPQLQANIHMCSCCPKKPKKFDTIEELRQHQSEKQYFCQWCHNRFKNKNEAERHQNSLHLRRHSWCCATLDRHFQAAFHPCNAIPPNTNASHALPQQPNVPAEADVCGYCGLQFPNFPTQDWAARSAHLTDTHKFGECNQSKKFYRADHFRQHLKHSHAGTSGKWTNMLENSCMKEEPPLTPEAQSQELLRRQQEQQQHEQQLQGAPVANMMGAGPGMVQTGYGVMGLTGGNGIQQNRINEEMHEEM